MDEPRLPYGKQISPNQIEMRELLMLARDTRGDAKELHAAIGKQFFPKPSNLKNEVTSGMNAFLAMRHYGLVTGDEQYSLTDLAEELLKTASEKELNEALAAHLLLNCHGMQLVEVIDSLESRGETINVTAVSRELIALGVDPGGSSGENVNPMRMWLERAGVLRNKWTVDSAMLKKLTGVSTTDISELVALPAQQQAILRALTTVTDRPPYLGSKLRDLAEAQSPGTNYDIKTFAAKVLEPLEEEGWITTEKATSGRGAKSFLVTPTDRFAEVISEPLMRSVLDQVHPLDPVWLRRPLHELLAIVNDNTKTNHERGLALEGVTIQVVRLIGARFLGWRLRGDDTNGAEVDVVAETILGPYQIIQLQSKAGGIPGREYVDREVGVATALKSNVILFVTSKEVGKAARKAAATHMKESGLAILFIDGDDLRSGDAGQELAGALEREWNRVRAIRSKRGQDRARALDE